MKRFKCFIILFFLIATQISFGQSISKADSLRNALKVATKLKDSVEILYEYIANEQNNDSIIKYSELYLTLLKNNKTNSSISSVYIHIGDAYSKKGDLERSILNFNKALEYAEDEDRIATINSNLASVYLNNGDYSKALEYYHLSVQRYEKTGDSLRLGTTLVSQTYAYFLNDEINKAVKSGIYAVKLFENLEIEYKDYYWAYAVGNLSLAYAKRGNVTDAQHGLDTALVILEKYQDEYAVADYKIQQANILASTDNKLSLILAKEGFEIAKKNGFKQRIVDGAELLSKLYKEQNDYKNAFHFLNEFNIYRDSITNADLIRKLAEAEKVYQLNQKQIEIDLLEIQKRNQQIVTISIAAILFISIIASFFIYRNYLQKTRLSKELASQKQKLEELNNTKSKLFSIISHDLRGPVHAFHGVSRMIKYFVNSKNTDQLIPLAEEIDQSVDRLSSLLDNLLNWAVQEQDGIPYNPEKINLNSTFKNLTGILVKVAAVKNIRIDLDIPQDHWIYADKPTTETIFRNLLSNALKFTPDGGNVSIKTSQIDNEIQVSISDTGIGIPQQKLDRLFEVYDKKSTYGTGGEKGLGLGLQLVNEFSNLNKARIQVSSITKEGTTFSLFFKSSKHEVVEKVH